MIPTVILEEILAELRSQHAYIRERDKALDKKQAESLEAQRRGLELAERYLPIPFVDPTRKPQ